MKLINLVSLSIVCVVLISCKTPIKKLPVWNYTKDIILKSTEDYESKSIKVDIYLDATTSMKGFTAEQNSNYNKYIDEIETDIMTGWKNAEITYFKFGSKIDPIERPEFLEAKKNDFYDNPKLFKTTNIDEVFSKSNPNKVSILITDLFQDAGDINNVTLSIKKNCFERNVELGILAIPSEFNGMVYDAPGGSYPFSSTKNNPSTYRPFYMLICGDAQHIIAFKKLIHVADSGKFILLSKNIVDDYTVALSRSETKASKGLSQIASDKGPIYFKFRIKEDFNSGEFKSVLNYHVNPYVPQINSGKINLEAFLKTAYKDPAKNDVVDTDSSKTQFIKLTEFKENINEKKTNIKLLLEGLPKKQMINSFLIYLQPSIVDGYIIPEWIKKISSENPSKNFQPNRTLHFEKFIEDLVRANMVYNKPKIAKFILEINKN